ncbi:MAG: 2-oxoacid:acceptor oxidoreductase subunit alpha [Planctomycetes bacterium]|nr:2-oxoacid:acceptor oxidoreductase subunit alpha [Planctomycetota bacterium]
MPPAPPRFRPAERGGPCFILRKESLVEPVVNDLSIQVATVNGSGSQTANSVLMRTIFQMGVPVSGKNLFPSNIAGLPTWFTIRASKDGWIARKKEIDILVAMNLATIEEDFAALRPGSVAIYNTDLKYQETRSDLIYYPVNFSEVVKECCPETKLRKLVTNMVYVGIVQHLLGLDPAEVEKAIRRAFKSKVKAADLNTAAARAGAAYAAKNLPKRDKFRIERMNKTAGKIIIEGNAAAAIGAIFGGVTFCAWYPITPSSSLCEALIEYAGTYRVDPETKKNTFAIVQAEDELASIGMVLSAGWAGARSMTTTSGPGVSLMSEFVGLGYYTECPGVIFDVQRVGPSTGLPTRTAQSDLKSLLYLSHGDTRHIVVFPANPEEAYQFSQDAFDLAERFQTPVFVAMDLDLGMNNWMADAFPYPTKPLDRGKVLSKADLDRLGKFERYADVDGDGIPYRTLPGNPHPLAGYFTRGSGHNEKAQYTEKAEDYVRNMDRLARKYETARKWTAPPLVQQDPAAKVGFIAFGTTHHAIVESQDQLKKEQGLPTSYLRIRALPTTSAIKEFVQRHERVYVVEQNRDGQMYDYLRLEVGGADALKLRTIRHYSGIPIDARSVTDALLAQEKEVK